MRILLLFALIVIATGAATAQTEKADEARLEIVPLSVGNAWTYSVKVPVKRNEMRDVEFVVSVSETTVIEGQVYFRFEGMNSQPVLFANGDSGLYAWRDDLAARQLILRYPARAGDTYVLGGKRDRENIVVDVVAIDVAVDVDGASHLAYHYRLTGPDNEKAVDALVVPGIGVVRFMASDVDRKRTSETTGTLVRHTFTQLSKSDPASDVR